MPPSERDGNQVMFTDVSGNAIRIQDYLNNRKTAALAGQVYNPEIGFALFKNVVGGHKYPYEPYYAAFSPRLSFAWNPKFQNAGLSRRQLARWAKGSNKARFLCNASHTVRSVAFDSNRLRFVEALTG
jgi:hypothetical protein